MKEADAASQVRARPIRIDGVIGEWPNTAAGVAAAIGARSSGEDGHPQRQKLAKKIGLGRKKRQAA